MSTTGLALASWHLEQESRAFEELRTETQAIWDDSAANAVTLRFEDPIAAVANELKASMAGLLGLLDRAEAATSAAATDADAAAELAPGVADSLQIMQNDIDDATYAYDLFLTYHGDAQALLPQVDTLIHQANSACG